MGPDDADGDVDDQLPLAASVGHDDGDCEDNVPQPAANNSFDDGPSTQGDGASDSTDATVSELVLPDGSIMHVPSGVTFEQVCEAHALSKRVCAFDGVDARLNFQDQFRDEVALMKICVDNNLPVSTFNDIVKWAKNAKTDITKLRCHTVR